MRLVVALIICVLVFSLGCIEKKTIDQPKGEDKQIKAILDDLGYDKIVVTPVTNTTQTTIKNYPSINWRVTAELPNIKANFFLPGNSTMAVKKAIILEEEKAVKSFVDKCINLSYENINIQMAQLGSPSNKAQSRQWSGTATMVISDKTAHIALNDKTSGMQTQSVSFVNLNKYLDERDGLTEYLNGFNRNNTIAISVRDSINYEYYAGIYYTYNGKFDKTYWEFMDEYDGGNRCKFQDAKLWLTASCTGIATRDTIQKAEDALQQKNYTLTFLSGK